MKAKLLKGMPVGRKTFKVHLDGYNITDALAGRSPSPRREFFYFNDDGSLVALRYDQWKVVFAEQRAEGLEVWQDPFVPLRFPKLFTLRADPFETADREGMDYRRWRIEHAFVLVPASSTSDGSWPPSRTSRPVNGPAASASMPRWRPSGVAPRAAASRWSRRGWADPGGRRLMGRSVSIVVAACPGWCSSTSINSHVVNYQWFQPPAAKGQQQ